MIISKKTGIKYLSVSEIEEIQNKIEAILKKYGINRKTTFHPDHIKVYTKEKDEV